MAGPLSVEEIAKDEEFSEATFVCPENESDNSESWKSADQYMQDFGYILDPEHYSKPEPEPEETPAENHSEQESPAAEEAPAAPAQDTQENKEISKEEIPSGTVTAEPEEVVLQETSLEQDEDIENPEPVFAAPQAPAAQESVKEISHPEITEKEEAPAQEPVAVYTSDLPKQDLPAAEIENPDSLEETIHSRSPLNMGMDDNLLDEIPASAVLKPEETNIPEEDNILKEENSAPLINKESTPEDIPVIEETIEDKLEETKSGLELLDKQREAEKSAADKPAVEEADEQNLEALDTFTVKAPVLHITPSNTPENIRTEDPLIQPEPAPEPRPEHNFELEEDDEDKILSLKDEEETVKEIFPNHGVINEKHEVDNALLSVQDSVNNQFIKSAPTTTGKIISSSDGRVSDRKNKRNDMIYLMVMFMFVLIIVALMMMFTSEKNKEAQAAQAKAAEEKVEQKAFAMDEPIARSVIQGYDEGLASPEVVAQKIKPVIPEKKLEQPKATAQDTTLYAEKLIKGAKLSDGKTIEEHFTELYPEPYQMKWKSNLLHGKTYVVDFFALKVRSEPIRYMFSIDLEDGEIVGLNAAAIDLVGKNLFSQEFL